MGVVYKARQTKLNRLVALKMIKSGELAGDDQVERFYSAAEAEGKQDEIGAVSDVYSLGATLYCLLTGRPPFQAATPTDTLRQVVNENPVSPRNLNSDIPRDLETICLKCLRKERTGRYATAQNLADDLSRWLENKPIVARRVSAVEKAWLWCKRKPVVVGSAVSVLLAIGIAAYITNENNRQATEDNNRTQRPVTCILITVAVCRLLGTGIVWNKE
jgi:eukaryotic-like serine/threonine-protein kinase